MQTGPGIKKPVPPRAARKILLSFLRDDLAEEVMGDLEEKFHATAKTKSLFRAKLNYLYQVIHYMRPFAIRKNYSTTQNIFIMYNNYFKIGWRNLLRNKGYSFINIGGLALGMSAAMLIGLWIFDELSYNRYYRNYNSIARVYRSEFYRGRHMVNTIQVTGLATLLQNEYNTHFSQVVLVRALLENRVIANGEKKFNQNGYFMQDGGPEMFSLKMISGSWNGLKDKNSILISESLSKKLFGNSDPVNQVVTMDGNQELKVTGVYRDIPKNAEFSEATYFAPIELYLGNWSNLNVWDNYNMYIYVQLAPHETISGVSSIIKDLMLPHINEERKKSKPDLFLIPMRDWHLFVQFENGVRVTSDGLKMVWLFGIIGFFVLSLACINFMNLSTARSGQRAREVGIRKTIGSPRGQLIQQFFGESVLVSFIALCLALLIVGLTLNGFNRLADKEISLPVSDPRFWGMCIGFVWLTGLLAGSYPALYLSSFSPLKVLKSQTSSGRSTRLPRRVLVVVQFTISFCIAIGTVIVYQQIKHAQNRPAGYTRQGLISMRTASPEFRGKFDELRTELIKTGVVEDIAESDYAVTDTKGNNDGFTWKGQKFEESFNTTYVTAGYGRTVGWDFIEGRDFSEDIASDRSGIIINESARKILGIPDPVGETLNYAPGWTKERGNFQILGVVRDMIKGSPFEPANPAITFLANPDMQWLYIMINPSVSAHEATPKIKSVFDRLVPSVPFDFHFADEDYDAKFRGEERIGSLASIFSILAILISGSGLFGLAAYVTEMRSREMSIRKVMGAPVSNLLRLISTEFFALVLISSLIAVPLSILLMEKWLGQFQYRITIGWPVFAIAVTGAICLTLITVSFQILKVALTDPVKNLRSE